MKVTLGQVNEVLERAISRLDNLACIAFADSDKRGDLLREKLSHETYGLAVNLFDLKTPDMEVPGDDVPKLVEVTDCGLSTLLSYICGRVLTYIELAVPAPEQSKAFKSLAGDIVWEIAKDIREASEAK